MGTLIIERNSEWNNKARCFKVFVDDQEVGKIGEKDILRLELEKGSHEVQAKIDWCTSRNLKFELSEGETKTVKLSGFKHSNLILFLSLILFLVYISMRYFLLEELNSFLILFLIPAFYPLYFITLGRKNYLRITEK